MESAFVFVIYNISAPSPRWIPQQLSSPFSCKWFSTYLLLHPSPASCGHPYSAPAVKTRKRNFAVLLRLHFPFIARDGFSAIGCAGACGRPPVCLDGALAAAVISPSLPSHLPQKPRLLRHAPSGTLLEGSGSQRSIYTVVCFICTPAQHSSHHARHGALWLLFSTAKHCTPMLQQGTDVPNCAIDHMRCLWCTKWCTAHESLPHVRPSRSDAAP